MSHFKKGDSVQVEPQATITHRSRAAGIRIGHHLSVGTQLVSTHSDILRISDRDDHAIARQGIMTREHVWAVEQSPMLASAYRNVASPEPAQLSPVAQYDFIYVTPVHVGASSKCRVR